MKYKTEKEITAAGWTLLDKVYKDVSEKSVIHKDINKLIRIHNLSNKHIGGFQLADNKWKIAIYKKELGEYKLKMSELKQLIREEIQLLTEKKRLQYQVIDKDGNFITHTVGRKKYDYFSSKEDANFVAKKMSSIHKKKYTVRIKNSMEE